MKEIIRSYYLVFGDDAAARQVYKNYEKKKAKALMGFWDPYLDTLCRLKNVKIEGID